LPELAKVPTDSNSEVDGESTTYSTPLFWNPIERTQSKDNPKFEQNPKRLRGNPNTKWNGYFRVKSVLPAKRSAEDISNSKAYISWFNGKVIWMTNQLGNQERVWSMLWNPSKNSLNVIWKYQHYRLEDKSGGEEGHLL
jgi:hypothetical protein